MRYMRRLAAPASAVVLLAFFTAPFLHLHTAGGAPSFGIVHEHEAIVHAHFPDRHPAGHHDADLTSAEEHDLSLSAFAVLVEQRAMPALPFLLPARIEAGAPAVCEEPFVPFCPPRGHDPPSFEIFPPRAPPA
jgi:hypothetical protein